ncbi:MAG: hypothetical protein JNL74_06870 [Fibrobacteres bacterium]|nr:hypothetical protein [Fibrobacterota bacterium]
MKKLIVLIMFLFATNLYSTCCIKPIYDSLYYNPSTIRYVGTVAVFNYSRMIVTSDYDSPKVELVGGASIYYTNPCDSFLLFMEGRGRSASKDSLYESILIYGYTFETGFILKKQYSFYNKTDRNGYSVIDYDTVLNYCKPVTAIKNVIAENETILNIKVYDIRGKLVTTRNYNKFNDLHGFYVFQYITDKRTYSQKKYFIK